MSYLLDSDWLVDGFVGRPNAVELIVQLRHRGLAASIISYGDVFEGAVASDDAQAKLAEFRAFLSRFAVAPLTDPIMEVFSRTRADLRRAGRLIPDLDLLIASTALHHDLILVTRNHRHFARIPELRIYDVS